MALLAFVVSILFVPHGDAATPTPLEVWTGGGDGLTLRLADAVRKAIAASPPFVASSGQRPGSLRVSIPTHVRWEKIGMRTKATTRIEVTRVPFAESPLGFFEVSCWDDELPVCADQIVKFTTQLR